MVQNPLSLTVWFDGDCGFCTRVAAWLRRQPQFVPVHCVQAQEAASAGCPFDLSTLLAKITVMASDGAVYRGSNAWIVVLWALRRYRRWALRFAQPRWRPFAEKLFATITGFAAWTKHHRRR